MVNVPDQLVWELVKKNNSFQKKKNGRSKRSGTVTFSVEKGNVKSLNQLKFSGLANTQTIDVVCTDKNRAQLITKSASKASNQPSKTYAKTNVNKDFRRSAKVIQGQTEQVFYRRDLAAATMGKYTKVYQANRRANGVTKPVPVKKGRGTN